MPELPDVEALRAYLNATSLHQCIDRVDVLAPELLRDVSPAGLQRRLQGDRFRRTFRHGKHVFAELERGPWLTMHFGMTGGLAYFKDKGETPRFTRLLIRFTNGYRLAYLSQRKLGTIGVVEDPGAFIGDHRLGPDAVDPTLTPEGLRHRLTPRRGAIKTILMNQHVIAGIGNLYADEILFQSRIAPTTPACRLDDAAIQRLERAMKRILLLAIARHADPSRFPRTWLWHARVAGGACPRCRNRLQFMKLGGRTTLWCPACQPWIRARGTHRCRRAATSDTLQQPPIDRGARIPEHSKESPAGAGA